MTEKNHFWLQHSIKHPGRVHRYVHKLFGCKAFLHRNDHDRMKKMYVLKAKERAEKHGNTSLTRAIDLALTMRKWVH